MDDTNFRLTVREYALKIQATPLFGAPISYGDQFLCCEPNKEPALLTCFAPLGFITSQFITAMEWDPQKPGCRIECDYRYCVKLDSIAPEMTSVLFARLFKEYAE